MRRRLLTAVLLLALAATACQGDKPSAPAPDSDSGHSYKGGQVPVDLAVYDITGQVIGDVSSLTRQVKPGGGTISAPFCAGTSGCFGGGGGTVFGPTEAGKGFVRLRVQHTAPATDLAREGWLVLLKVTDTKATALLPGDVVTFRCRREYEAVAAERDYETFDAAAVATWELDQCRLATPSLGVDPAGKS